jgi:hypothetical protein
MIPVFKQAKKFRNVDHAATVISPTQLGPLEIIYLNQSAASMYAYWRSTERALKPL